MCKHTLPISQNWSESQVHMWHSPTTIWHPRHDRSPWDHSQNAERVICARPVLTMRPPSSFQRGGSWSVYCLEIGHRLSLRWRSCEPVGALIEIWVDQIMPVCSCLSCSVCVRAQAVGSMCGRRLTAQTSVCVCDCRSFLAPAMDSVAHQI